jgi:hypothetical protein
LLEQREATYPNIEIVSHKDIWALPAKSSPHLIQAATAKTIPRPMQFVKITINGNMNQIHINPSLESTWQQQNYVINGNFDASTFFFSTTTALTFIINGNENTVYTGPFYAEVLFNGNCNQLLTEVVNRVNIRINNGFSNSVLHK